MFALPTHHLVFLVLVGAGYCPCHRRDEACGQFRCDALALWPLSDCRGLLAAIVFEIILLRKAPVSQLYLIVIAVETAIVLSFTCLIGEQITPRLALGMGFIFVGLATVAH